MHRLVRLIYCSRMKGVFTEKDFNDIVVGSSKYNDTHQITGILCQSEGIFLQCIEGSRKTVSELYSRIVRDERHTQICLVGFEEISSRYFIDWSIGWLTDEINLRYSSTRNFNPFEMSMPNCLMMLKEMSEKNMELQNRPIAVQSC